MRYGAIGLILILALAACKSTGPTAPEPEPGSAVPTSVLLPTARTLLVRPLEVTASRPVDAAVVAAIDSALRDGLAGTGQYELAEEGAELVLTPRIQGLGLREVGAGSRFSMRDLGLDPGPEYIECAVVLTGTLAMGGTDHVETVTTVIRGGDGTPGVTRVDLDGDGRLDLKITPEGVAALLRPAIMELTKKLLAVTHPAPAPEVEVPPSPEAPAEASAP